jgi:branched-subunit amino acid ABC-type transport system permease component
VAGEIVAAAIVTGGTYALVSVGFALAFRISGVFNMAHGGVLVLAAYLNAALSEGFGSQGASILCVLPVCAALGLAVDGIAIPFAKGRGFDGRDLLILSWLLLTVIQNVLSIVFSNSSIYLGGYSPGAGGRFLGVAVTPNGMLVVLSAAVAAAGCVLIGRSPSLGLSARAIGDDPRLATICGLRVALVVRSNAVIAALFTAGAGILLSYQQRIDPSLGLRFSLVAIVATLAGQRFGLLGALAGAFGLAFFESLVLYLVDPGLKDAAVYACLIAVVLWTQRRVLLERSVTEHA